MIRRHDLGRAIQKPAAQGNIDVTTAMIRRSGPFLEDSNKVLENPLSRQFTRAANSNPQEPVFYLRRLR